MTQVVVRAMVEDAAPLRHKRSRSITLDAVKMLQEKRSKFERGILKLTGAARLAEEQLMSVGRTGACSLCAAHGTASNAEVRVQRTLLLCESSRNKYLAKREACIGELQKIGGKDTCAASMRSDEWCSFEYKKGKLATLREQKMQSLKLNECVVCGSDVTCFSAFLSSVDRQIGRLEAELHVHQSHGGGFAEGL